MNTPQVVLAALLWGIAGSGLIALACTLLARVRRLRAGVAHSIWFAAIVAMGLLPLVAVGGSLLRATHAPPARVAGASAPAPRAPASTGQRTASAAAGSSSASASGFDFTAVLLMLAAAGALAGVGSVAYSLVQLRAMKRRSSPLDESLSHDLPWLAETIEGRETYLRLSYEIETPIAIGFGRPVILIPTDLANENGLAAIESLVIHEHAHLKHYDDYTNLVQRFIERLYWFNPFVWYAGRHLTLAREMAADDAVLDRGEDKAGYAQTLWRLAREMRMPSQPIVAPGALFTRKQISQRIEAILAANRGQLAPLDPTAVAAGIALAFFTYGLVVWLTPAFRLPALPETALGAWPQGPLTVAMPTPGIPALPRMPAVPSMPAMPSLPPLGTAGDVRKIEVAVRTDGAEAGAAHARGGSFEPGCTSGCDFDGHNFRGVELHDISFSGSSMDKADFTGARLRNVGFEGTSLDGANFDGAELDHVRFNGASIDGASFLGAKLTRTTFHGVDITSAHFDNDGLRAILVAGCDGCDVSGMKLRGADLSGLELSGINMSDVDLTGADLRGAKLNGVQLDDAKLDNADLTGATLTGCSLSGVSTKNTRLDRITLVGSSFD
jgi:uncharacterized protein YjbI with pentapeptide repeats/beta-lactamase regulating signal transducer with metallopeptidase domain